MESLTGTETIYNGSQFSATKNYFNRKGAETQRKHLFNPQMSQIFAESIF